MSLNCLLCEKGGCSPEINQELAKRHYCCHCYGRQRSLSAILSPSPYNSLRRNSSLERRRSKDQFKVASSVRTLSNKVVKHTVAPSEIGEPRLMRSGGMRRDWSFEDLRNQRNARKR